MSTILVADDEVNILSGLKLAFEDEGYTVITAKDGLEAWKEVNSNNVDLVITDLRMPVLDGYELIKRIASSYPTLPVIVLTGHGTIETAVETMRDGAVDFFTKPVDLEKLLLVVRKSIANSVLKEQNRRLTEEIDKLKGEKKYQKIIGKSGKVEELMGLIKQVAPTKASVLITGESGTGKELVASALVALSPRKDKPFVKVHCASLSPTLLESELFGHEKGSFTGAVEMRKGYFEEADGGTLFLDEIGELPMPSQAKLLRVLQSGEFIRVGSSKVLKTDVRVVAATNVNLMHAVSKGKFREDLYYRLNAVPIMMPALRERQDDIHLLFRKFASDFSEKYGMAKVSLAPDAVALLKSYRWPGNIRQLKNVAETVSALESEKISLRTDRFEINAEVLARYIPKDDPNMLPVKSANIGETVNPSEREAIIRMIYQLRQEVDYLKEVVLGTGTPVRQLPQVQQSHAGVAQEPGDDADWQDAEGQEMPGTWTGKVINLGEGAARPADNHDEDSLSLQKAGSGLIRKALEKYKGNRKLAAAELGISERTLYRKLKSIDNE